MGREKVRKITSLEELYFFFLSAICNMILLDIPFVEYSCTEHIIYPLGKPDKDTLA